MTVVGHITETVVLYWAAVWVLSGGDSGSAWFCTAILLTLVFVFALGLGIKQKMAARRVAERQKVARLVRHADEEHRLIQRGSLDGVYGGYGPPPALRGAGIWMSDK